MRVLHTSDWHLGQSLYGYSRMDEYADFFAQLLQIAMEKEPDALVVSGDIFDVSNPSANSLKMFTDFILQMHEALPEMCIVITSGNHDSASRIDINRNLWRSAGIHVIGTVGRDKGAIRFEENIIRVGHKGLILAIPYLNRAAMCVSDKSDSPERQFFAMAAQAVAEVNDYALPVVLMAHLSVEGCDTQGHRFGAMGMLDTLDSNVFGDDFDYVALGHIHKPQNIDHEGRVRYCGTPLAVNFDEAYSHTITIVDVERDRPLVTEEIGIKQMRPLRTVPEEAVDFKSALKVLSKLADNEDCYVRLNVLQEGLPTDCEELATAAVKDKACRYCTLKVTRPETQTTQKFEGLTASEFVELQPEEIAGRFFAIKGLTPETTEKYLELIRNIETKLNNQNAE